MPRPIKHTVNMVNRRSVRAMEKEDPLPIKCIVYLREKVFCFMFYVVVVVFFYFCLGFLLFSLETSTLSPVYIFLSITAADEDGKSFSGWGGKTKMAQLDWPIQLIIVYYMMS